MHLLIIYTVQLFYFPVCIRGNIIPLCWTYNERPVLQWKHYIKLLISTLTHWNSLKHEMDSFSTSLFTSRHIGELGCCQQKGRQILLFLSQNTSCTIPLSIFFLLTAVWSMSGLENPIWMLLQKENVSGKGL